MPRAVGLDEAFPKLHVTPMPELDGIHVENRVDALVAGLVVARGCRVEPAGPGLAQALDSAIAAAAARTDLEPSTKQVRDLLRHGKYKPTGRGKPASEYLVNAAKEGRFPRINNLVDACNLVSVESLLPISLVDLRRAGTDRFQLRRGRAGEAYVFNSAGQTIELEDLLLVAKLPEDLACANPVKDSMATKLDAAAEDVLGVLYAPLALAAGLEVATARFAQVLKDQVGAARVSHHVARPNLAAT